MISQEVEAKFIPRDDRVLAQMERLTALGPFRRKSRRRERQWNRYWDTADGRLRAAGAVLKERRVGARVEWTFKRKISYRQGISRRLEVTADPLRQARKITGLKPLKKILTMRTDRIRLRFALGQQEVELDLDRVEVLQAGRVVGRYKEAELENITARSDRFQTAFSAFRRLFPGRVRLSRMPKVERGLRLLKSWRGGDR